MFLVSKNVRKDSALLVKILIYKALIKTGKTGISFYLFIFVFTFFNKDGPIIYPTLPSMGRASSKGSNLFLQDTPSLCVVRCCSVSLFSPCVFANSTRGGVHEKLHAFSLSISNLHLSMVVLNHFPKLRLYMGCVLLGLWQY